MSQPITLSLPEARRFAIASQAFGRKPAKPTTEHLRKLAAKLSAFQIDSVNVLTRAHYVPAFARLGPYSPGGLDSLAYRKRELFEYWGHAACLLPISMYPLLRYRMRTYQAREYMRSKRGAFTAKVYAEVCERGPIAAAELSEPGRRSGNWWGWGPGKETLEYLYDAGLVAIAGRRGFERLYDVAERVIPQAALDAPAPPREEAMKQLICLGAMACGVGTLGDIAGYLKVDGFQDRMPEGPWWERAKDPKGRPTKPIVKRLVSELVEARRLLPARVEGWKEQAYVLPGVRVPRSVDARALVTPFDSPRVGPEPRRAALRHEVRPRDLRPGRQARLRLLRVPVPARGYGRRALRPEGRPPGEGPAGAECLPRRWAGSEARRSAPLRRAPADADLARVGPYRRGRPG